MTHKITIIGGGIAGLTTALALNKIGIKPTIFEKAQTIKAIGAGLVLAANAIKAFQKLDISDEVIKCGRLIPSFTLYDQKGNPITKTDSKAIGEKYGVDNFTIHRTELHKLLLSKISSDSIHTNKCAVDIEQTNSSVIIKFQDGSFHETNFLIIADGIHSLIRKKLLPNTEPRYSGYTCWRSVIDNINLNLTETSETWGTAGRFGIVPLVDNKIYWFACVNAPQNNNAMKQYKVADLQNHFKDFHEPIPTLLRQTKDENLIWNDIIDLKPISRYAFDNIVLIGDAAHATTPNLGQGACQAIEDAIILADELKNNSDVKIVFKQFEQRRIKRTHYIVNKSWTVGKVAQVENKTMASLRNFVFRLLPASLNERLLKSLYEVDF